MTADKKHLEEINELAAELGLSAETAQEMREDIEVGDELLRELDDVDLPVEVAARMEALIERRLNGQRRYWLRPVVAAAAVVAVALLGLYWFDNSQPTSMPPDRPGAVATAPENAGAVGELTATNEDHELWEWALTELNDDYNTELLNEMTVTELLIMFDEAQLFSPESVGKEYYHESSHQLTVS